MGAQTSGWARRVTILLNHADSRAGYARVLQHLHDGGAERALVLRPIAAFAPGIPLHTARLADVAPDLPVMILWIDLPERVEALLPGVRAMMPGALITIEDVEMIQSGDTGTPHLPPALPVEAIMTSNVLTVAPETPVTTVVDTLLRRSFRAVPVVDAEGHPIGIVTNGDLVQRGGLSMRLDLLRGQDTLGLQAERERLATDQRTAADVMTAPVVTIAAAADIHAAARSMRQRKVKRLPVVDDTQRLVGIVSRLDLLRSMAAKSPADDDLSPPVQAEGSAPISSIMSASIPVVSVDAPLGEVLNVLTSTRLHRAVVVDAGRHVVGIITARELLERLVPEHRSGLRALLARRVPFVHGNAADEEVLRRTGGKRAADVMVPNIRVAWEGEPIRDVLTDMLREQRKIVPVVDGEERLVGIVDRSDLLGVLLAD